VGGLCGGGPLVWASVEGCASSAGCCSQGHMHAHFCSLRTAAVTPARAAYAGPDKGALGHGVLERLEQGADEQGVNGSLTHSIPSTLCW